MWVSCYHRRRAEARWGLGGQQRDVLYIFVFSQQLHLGEQEDPHCLHTHTYELFSTHPLWTQTEMCDGSQWLPTSPSHHRCISVTNQSFDVRQRGIQLQGPVWHRAVVLDNAAQRATEHANAKGQRNRQIKKRGCSGCHLKACDSKKEGTLRPSITLIQSRWRFS